MVNPPAGGGFSTFVEMDERSERMSKDKQELKVCPFCGGEASFTAIRRGTPRNLLYIACGDCLASTTVATSESQAIAAWNRRTNDELVLQIAASLTLADHLGDISNAIQFAVSRAGYDITWSSADELYEKLSRLGVTTVNGTHLGEEE